MQKLSQTATRYFPAIFLFPIAYFPNTYSGGEFAKHLVFYLIFFPLSIACIKKWSDPFARDKNIFLLFGFFLIWCAICMLNGPVRLNGIGYILSFAGSLCVCIVTSLYARHIRLYHCAVVSTIITGILSGIGLLQAAGIHIPYVEERASPASLFINKNYAAHYFALAFPLCVGLLLSEKTARRCMLWAVSFFLQAAYVLATGTRGVLVSLIIAALVIGFFLLLAHFREKSRGPREAIAYRKRKILFLVVATILLVSFEKTLLKKISTSEISPTSIERIGNMFQQADGRYEVRIALWMNTIEMIKEYPIFGVGPNSFIYMYGKYADRVLHTANADFVTIYEHPHNEYLNIAVETGLIGLSIFLGFMFLLIRRLVSYLVRPGPGDTEVILRTSLIWGVFTVLVYANFEFPFLSRGSGLLLWVYLGLILGHEETPTVSKKTFYASEIFRALAVIFIPVQLAFAGFSIYAGRKMAESMLLEKTSGCAPSLAPFKIAAKFLPFDGIVQQQFISSMIACASPGSDILPSIDTLHNRLPNLTKLWYYGGIIAIEQGHRIRAEYYADLLQKHLPYAASGHFLRAILLQNEGKTTEAAMLYEKAEKLSDRLRPLIADFKEKRRKFGDTPIVR